MKRLYLCLLRRFLIILLLGNFISCDLFYSDVKTIYLDDFKLSMDEIASPGIKSRQWTILVYMAADNDLEAAALEDLCEMEVSKLNTEVTSVFVLLDRSNTHDTSNGNWSGTKLYKLKTGRSRQCRTIISEEINCEDLGIYTDVNTELDMSSGYTLAKALNYIKRQFPSDYLGLIMWGHGTGWRNKENNDDCYKGFAYDKSSGSYMTLKQLGDCIESALNGDKLDLLGLDTCFGAEIEVMYELMDKAKYAVGTEGLQLLSGWNYENIFNRFSYSYDKSPKNFINICIEDFSIEYDLSSYASIAGIDMSYMRNYFLCFDEIMKIVAKNINNKNIRDNLFNSLYKPVNCKTQVFGYGDIDSDIYLDIDSLMNTCLGIFPENNELSEKINEFKQIRANCIFKNWSSESLEGGLGVYFGTLTAGNLIGKTHDKSYWHGSVIEQIKFVKDSSGYVPGQIEMNSFLDKLFYYDY